MFKKIRVSKFLVSSLAKASIGGILSGLSLFEGISFLMPLGIAFLWSSSKQPLSGFVWGLIAVLYSHKWILALHPLSWVGIPIYLSLPIAIFIWLFCGIFGGLLVFLWSCFLNRIRKVFNYDKSFYLEIIIALTFCLVWGLSEILLSKGSLFWIGISGSLLPQNRWLAGLARILGAGGLATIQVLIGWWLWQLKIVFPNKNKFRKLISCGFICLLLGHLGGNFLINDSSSSQSLNVALWQTNIPIREKYSQEQRISFPLKYKSVLEKAKALEASLLIAPEGTLSSDANPVPIAPIDFFTGGFRSVDNNIRNSLLVIPQGKRNYSQALDKHRLVPLGEWVPKYFSGLSFVGGLQPGEYSRLLEWEGPPVIGAICYEISDGRSISEAAIDGGEWILSISNLDPYPRALQKQFLALAQLRSIESGRDLVSVSNTGPTSLIKSSGEVKYSLPPFVEDLGLVEVDLSNKITFYSLFRETPLILLLIINFLLLLNYKIKS